MSLLPGQTLTANGVSNLTFGTNVLNGTEQDINNQTSALLAGGFTLIRASFAYVNSQNVTVGRTDTQINSMNAAIIAAGCKPLWILSMHMGQTYNAHCMSLVGSTCNLYEFGNEPDISGFTWQQYLTLWNQQVPTFRAINPNAAFIGPVLGVFNNVQNYLVPWLQGCKTSGVIPDAVSYHVYPCTSQPGLTPLQALAKAPNIGNCGAQLRQTVNGVLGYNLPICCTEWNVDANFALPFLNDATFQSAFVTAALDGFVTNQIEMANQFCIERQGGNLLTSNGSHDVQYAPFVAEISKYMSGGGGTPTGAISVTPATLSATTNISGAGVAQTVTLKNTGNATGNVTTQISYSDAAGGLYGSLNWATISIGSATLAAGASTTAQITVQQKGTMPAGVYTANIIFNMSGGGQAHCIVTMTVRAAGAGTSHIYVPTNANPTDPSGTGTTWAQYEAGTPAVSFIVANVSNGPGSSADSNFTTGIAAMHAAGVKVLGYVNTSSASVPIAASAVQAQIDSWYSFYNIDGITLDGVIATTANITYYSNLHTYIKAKSTTQNYVFLNAGMVPPETYMPLCDTVNVYQNNLGNLGQFQPQGYMANYPSSKFAAQVIGVTSTTVVDSTVAAFQNANVGLLYITDQTDFTTPPGTSIWNELILKSNVGTGTTGGSGGTTATPTALAVYFANAAASTISTANKLYITPNSTAPTTTWKYSRIGTATGYGEITSQGTTSAWAAAGSLPAPTGKGFLLDTTSLEGQTIQGGNWSGVVRLNCAQNGDSNPQAGTITADIIARIFKVNGSTYTPIVTLTLANQTITSAFTSYTLPNTSAPSVDFATGDKLYIGLWLNVTTNANASSVQDIRISRESTDTGGTTGDVNATIGTPGYLPTGSSGGIGTSTAADTFVRANQSGWGTASGGGTYTETGTGTPTIISNKGVMVSTSSDTHMQLGASTLADVDLRVRVAIGAGLDAMGIEGRYSVSGGNVTSYKLVWAGGILAIKKCVAGTNTTLASVGYTVAAGVVNQLHLRIQGSNLYGNLYVDGTGEPSNWMLTTTDSTITAAGGFALLANTTGGSSGVQFDQFSATTISSAPLAPLTASPASLAFAGVQGGGATGAQNVTLTNSGSSAAWATNITYQQGFGWLALNSSSGTLSSTQVVAITANPSGLGPGTYTAVLTFTLGGSASQTVFVTFVVASSAGNATVLLTDAGRNLIRDGWQGKDNPLLSYFALGSTNTAPTVGDIVLGSEFFRKAITAFTNGTNPGELIISCYIGPQDAVGSDIEEVGIYGGSAANTLLGSGVLLARGLYAPGSKTNLQSIQLTLDIQIP